MQPGTHLGHYEILEAIGKGGMGEVWRARDTMLGREVAIKTLPDEFAQDADRVARFEREAKLLASLNHPNIAAIHGLEEADVGAERVRFLVLELVEGDTLGDRLKRGAVPVEDALKLALQIADALKAAHESGVIHRDLKPDNIKVSEEGNVKVLDFGLAKAMAGDESVSDVSNSPTLSMAATQAGVILGTAAYMSPEQAKGRAVDKRTDVWALGCVLYEMLTGRQSFGASDVTESLAAVIRSEPEWSALPADLHPRVREILERCLAKSPAGRYQDVGDVKADVARVLTDSGGVMTEPAGAPVPAPASRILWPAALLASMALTAFVVWNLRVPDPPRVARFSDEIPAGQTLTQGFLQTVAVAPDGGSYVYASEEGIHLRPIGGQGAELIRGADGGATNPFFSPDGAWVGYFSDQDDELKKIPVTGGTPQRIAAVRGNVNGADWYGDTIFFSDSGGIMRVPDAGGEPQPVGQPAEGFMGQVLPGGRHLLVTRGSFGDPESIRILAVSVETGEAVELGLQGTSPRYVSTGHLLYTVDNALYAVRFDPNTLEVSRNPLIVADRIRSDPRSGIAEYALSDAGTLVHIVGEGYDEARLVWVGPEGLPAEIETIPPGPFESVRLSPDGRRILTFLSDTADYWIYDVESGRSNPLTGDGLGFIYAVWDPVDGSRIAYSSSRGGSGATNVWIQPSDGSGEPSQLTDLEGSVHVDSWSADGRILFVHHHEPDGRTHILMLDLADPGAEPVRFLDREFSGEPAVVSPDGKWVAYSSQGQIYLTQYPGPGGQYSASRDGGTDPTWGPDNVLFFRDIANDRMMRVAVSGDGADPDPSEPELVFEGYYLPPAGASMSYDVSPDGQRFLMRSPAVPTSG